jgi:hypothetical protein
MKAVAAVVAAVVAVGALLFVATERTAPPEPEFTQADRQAIAAEIERLSSEMNQLSRPEDQAAWLTYWSDSADSYFVAEPAVFAQGVRILTTMDSFREFFDPSQWNRRSTNFTTEPSHIAVLSPDVAIQVTGGYFSITNMEGETGPNYPISLTTVWVREGDAWKIIHNHQSWTNTPIEAEPEG